MNKDNEAGGGEGGWEWFRNPMARLLLRRTAVLGNDTCRQSNEAVDPNKPFPNVQLVFTPNKTLLFHKKEFFSAT